MTEPVAYLQLDIHGKEMVHIEKDMNGYETKPLYTAEQLHPRVKMTQAEFDEWKELYEDRHATTIYDFIIYVLNRSDSYPDMTNKLMCGSGAVKAKSQAKIADLIVNYNPDDPEETIEIVPNMKWFVRSKEPRGEDEDEYYLFLSGYNLYDLEYFPFNVNAKQFDTKEEAERWENPLTEAVLLPIEGNDI